MVILGFIADMAVDHQYTSSPFFLVFFFLDILGPFYPVVPVDPAGSCVRYLIGAKTMPAYL